MRQASVDSVGKVLTDLLSEVDPLEEDIAIVDSKGAVLGVVISPRAHAFLMRKVEEEEDRLDNEAVNDFHDKGNGHA